MTMSRQLPMLRGRKECNLCAAGSPVMAITDRLFLTVAPGAFSIVTGFVLNTGVKSERLSCAAAAGPSSWLLLLWEQDAKLSLDRNSCCRVRGAESSSMISSEQLLVWGLVETTVLKLVQLPPNWLSPSPASPPFSAFSRDWSFPPSTSLMGDSVSSHDPCLSRDRRRHSVERNDDLAGGGSEGRSDFFRFPCWSLVAAVTYPQNTESRWQSGREAEGSKQCKQRVSASRQWREGRGFS